MKCALCAVVEIDDGSGVFMLFLFFFFSSRRRHTRLQGDLEFRRVLFRSEVHIPIVNSKTIQLVSCITTSSYAVGRDTQPRNRPIVSLRLISANQPLQAR